MPGFYGEGPTDHRFLKPLILRLMRELLQTSREEVEIHFFNDIVPDDRTLRSVIDTVRSVSTDINLLFIHADGKGRPEQAIADRVEPILEVCRELRLASVPLIPVHEMEAWALADGDALRRAFGTTRSDADLGLPASAAEIERLADPKQVLREAHRRALGRSRRRTRKELPLSLVADTVALDRLRGLSAFRAFEQATRAALRELRLLA